MPTLAMILKGLTGHRNQGSSGERPPPFIGPTDVPPPKFMPTPPLMQQHQWGHRAIIRMARCAPPATMPMGSKASCLLNSMYSEGFCSGLGRCLWNTAPRERPECCVGFEVKGTGSPRDFRSHLETAFFSARKYSDFPETDLPSHLV